jgi:hypothetical protein
LYSSFRSFDAPDLCVEDILESYHGQRDRARVSTELGWQVVDRLRQLGDSGVEVAVGGWEAFFPGRVQDISGLGFNEAFVPAFLDDDDGRAVLAVLLVESPKGARPPAQRSDGLIPAHGALQGRDVGCTQALNDASAELGGRLFNGFVHADLPHIENSVDAVHETFVVLDGD